VAWTMASSSEAARRNDGFDMLKWSFLFWIGHVAAVAGLIAFMLRRP
jgi:hypothetical protein